VVAVSAKVGCGVDESWLRVRISSTDLQDIERVRSVRQELEVCYVKGSLWFW
jgi:hypothetical protein